MFIITNMIISIYLNKNILHPDLSIKLLLMKYKEFEETIIENSNYIKYIKKNTIFDDYSKLEIRLNFILQLYLFF